MIRLQVLAAGHIGEVPGMVSPEVSPLIDRVIGVTGLTVLVTTLIVHREARDAALRLWFDILSHRLFLLFLHAFLLHMDLYIYKRSRRNDSSF